MIVIRNAKNDDAKSIVEFQLAMAFETEQIKLEEKDLTKGVLAVFNDKSKGMYIIAESERQVIASLLLTDEWSDWRNGKILWIQSVYVLPDFRGKGVYRKMYDFVREIINSDENIKGVRLYVDKTNLAAQKVYESLGMNGDHYATFEWMK